MKKRTAYITAFVIVITAIALTACTHAAETPDATQPPVTEIVAATNESGEVVTDEAGETVTQIVEIVTEQVEVTDSNGEAVTDESGEKVTEIVTEKKPVVRPTPTENGSTTAPHTSRPATDKPTEKPTQKPTNPVKPTEKPTQKPTQKPPTTDFPLLDGDPGEGWERPITPTPEQTQEYTQADYDRIIREVTAYAKSYKAKGFTFVWDDSLQFDWETGWMGTPRIHEEGVDGVIETLKYHVDKIVKTGTDPSYGLPGYVARYKVMQVVLDDGDIAFVVLYG